VESIKASGLENEAFINWSASFKESLEEMQKQSLANALIGAGGSTSGFLLRTSVVLLGGLLIIVGQISLGELMAFQFLMGLIQSPLQQLTMISSQLQQLDGEMGRLNDIADTAIDPAVRSFQLSAVNATLVPERQLQGHIELRNLAFQFSHTTPLMFEGLNLDLAPGQHLAIVGSSGSGKSTLLRLICGLMQPTRGAIYYDGRSWMDWDDPTLRHSMALISQDVFVFSATLQENLTLWDGRFSEANSLDALADAGLLDELGGAAALHRQWHLRCHPAPCGHADLQDDRRGEQGRGGAHVRACRLRSRGRPVQCRSAADRRDQEAHLLISLNSGTTIGSCG
jgi:ATP-binding cassette subfamily B protein